MSPFGILGGFVAALEVALGLALVVGGVLALRRLRRAPDALDGHESRRTLLLAAGLVLSGLVVAGLPLLHLHLRGMVPEWPGVRCVEGITRIGTGAPGATGWLPGLTTAIELGKLLALLACGAFVALHRVDRRQHAPRLARAVLLLLVLGGLTAAFDGAATLAWLAIPKVPETDAAGCCSDLVNAFLGSAADAPRTWSAPVHLGLVGALGTLSAWRGGSGRAAAAGPWTDGALLLVAAAALPSGRAFGADVVAPVTLGLPHHRCLWCLLQQAPESLVAGALLVGGSASAAWAAVVGIAARSAGVTDETARRLAHGAALALAGYAVMILAGWAVA